jgi:dTDP-4-dehydrorhamnose reductase
MLGHDLTAACREAGHEVFGYDLPELDLTKDDGGLDRVPPGDWVVNCAAYTDVDGAQSHRDTAFAVNAGGAGRAAAWCAGRGVPFVHISTDYVFDGMSKIPYREDAPVHPLNVYGESKLRGEEAVQAAGGRHLIVRTQSLFGIHGKNFVAAILQRLEAGGPLKVVNDQASCPTYTAHLAAAILHLMRCGRLGIVHVSASGECTWFEMACAIARSVRPDSVIQPVTAQEFGRPARRPAYSVLDKSRYEEWTGRRMPSWQDGLEAYLAERSRRAARQTQD